MAAGFPRNPSCPSGGPDYPPQSRLQCICMIYCSRPDAAVKSEVRCDASYAGCDRPQMRWSSLQSGVTPPMLGVTDRRRGSQVRGQMICGWAWKPCLFRAATLCANHGVYSFLTQAHRT
eukprot:1997713-Pyramimonas_sp.AAC.2